MVLVSNAQKGTKIHRESTATLDDEHTPGIFTVSANLFLSDRIYFYA